MSSASIFIYSDAQIFLALAIGSSFTWCLCLTNVRILIVCGKGICVWAPLWKPKEDTKYSHLFFSALFPSYRVSHWIWNSWLGWQASCLCRYVFPSAGYQGAQPYPALTWSTANALTHWPSSPTLTLFLSTLLSAPTCSRLIWIHFCSGPKLALFLQRPGDDHFSFQGDNSLYIRIKGLVHTNYFISSDWQHFRNINFPKS